MTMSPKISPGDFARAELWTRLYQNSQLRPDTGIHLGTGIDVKPEDKIFVVSVNDFVMNDARYKYLVSFVFVFTRSRREVLSGYVFTSDLFRDKR